MSSSTGLVVPRLWARRQLPGHWPWSCSLEGGGQAGGADTWGLAPSALSSAETRILLFAGPPRGAWPPAGPGNLMSVAELYPRDETGRAQHVPSVCPASSGFRRAGPVLTSSIFSVSGT